MIAVTLTVLGLYLAFGTLLAVLARRAGVRSSVDYYVAGYKLGGFLAAMTYAATTYSAFMIVGLVGFAYSTGAGSLGFELTYFVATMALLTVLGPRVWELARKRKWVSPGEMLSDLYGSKAVGAAAAILYLVALIPYMGAQVKGIAEAFDSLLPGSYTAGVAVAVAVMVLWTLLAGVWSVAATDAMQGLWMIAASLTLLAWLVSWLASNGVGFHEATTLLDAKGLLSLTGFWAPHVFLGFTIPWIFFAATNPQVVQRLFMPRDPTAFRRMVAWFAVFGLAYTVIVTLIGLLARAATEAGLLPLIKSKDAVTPTLITLAGPGVASLVFTSIVAAAVSTADSIALSVASSVVRDLYMVAARRPSERMQIAVGATVVALLIALAALVAVARVGFIVALSVLSSAILLSLAPATLMAWAAPGRVEGRWPAALASIAVGASIGLTATAVYGVKALTTTWLGLPVPGWVLVASTATLLALYPVRASRGAS